MKIPVIFVNGSLGVICGEDLEEMLDKKLIVAFQRSSGLAIVGRDELRNNRGDGNGSWRNRKKNRLPHEEAMILPQRPMIRSSCVYEMSQRRIEAAPLEYPPITANKR